MKGLNRDKHIQIRLTDAEMKKWLLKIISEKELTQIYISYVKV